ncbi:MAG TPA: tail fiber domain-containing protein [Chitinophagaceae bacterium]|jgi:hypothetical protein
MTAFVFVLQYISIAQTGQWKLSGNSLNGTQKLGSTNNTPVSFFTNNTQRMSISATGLVGIGTSFPHANLHIFEGNSGNTPSVNSTIATESDRDNFISLLAPAANKTAILFGTGLNNQDGAIVYNNPTAKSGMQFNTGGAITRMTLTNTGALGIGTGSPKGNLHVFGGNSGIAPFANSTIVTENTNDNFISVLAPTAKETGVLFGTGASNQDGAIVYNNPNVKSGMQFNTASITRMTLTSKGFLGLGTTAPSTELHILHGPGFGNHGLRLQNVAANGRNWTIFETDDAFLTVASDVVVGFFDPLSGDYSALSDRRAKKDIEQAPDVLEKVMQLQVKKYHFLQNKSSDKMHFGMIAQEVEKIFPEIVTIPRSDNDRYAVNYSAYGVIAIKAIQEQQKKMEEQVKQIQQQEQAMQQQQQKIVTLEERIAKLEMIINHNSVSSTGSNNSVSNEINAATLEQNQPNPFNQSTVIQYRLPQGSTAQINLYDMNGVLVKLLKADESGQTTINSGDLKAGTYTYTLVVNGKTSASKKMVLIK